MALRNNDLNTIKTYLKNKFGLLDINENEVIARLFSVVNQDVKYLPIEMELRQPQYKVNLEEPNSAHGPRL